MVRFIVTIFFLIIIVGCSASNYTERYNKKIKEDKPAVDNSVRFSSENDIKPNNKEITYYNNPEFDEEPVEDVIVDTKEFIKANKIPASLKSTFTKREKILFEIISYLETPYKYGGTDKNGIDCSAFTQNVFQKALNLTLPRTASEQFLIGNKVARNNLKFGDLIFFNTTKNRYPGHVGIYLGNNLFAHSGSSKGVTVSSLQSTYFAQRFIGGLRIIKDLNSP